ncbi:DinB family protein [Chitinophaga sp.]|uniref:DinB family protein n=1 Tax=Chitinophaga sp. TaxID=1869181 RepID=UPI0031DF2D3B
MKVATMYLLAVLLGATSITRAQSTNEALVKEWERAKAYSKEYLDAMPDKDYGLKPTPEMRSFADQFLHLTDANYGFISAVSGQKSPVGFGESEKSTDKSKAAVTKAVMDGYDYVIASIKKIPASELNDKINLFGKFELTKQQAIDKAFEHQTHHRGQATVYLRLAGVKPPQEKLF